MKDRVAKVRSRLKLVLPTAILSIFVYILLHEFGHVIVLWTVGADITEFSISGAHVSYNGGQWTNLSDRWMHLNGAFFPWVVSIAISLLYKKECINKYYRTFTFFFTLMTTCSLIAWVVIPFFYMAGQAPENDDVYKFLYNFTVDYPAYLVSIVAVILMGFGIFVAVKKGILSNFYSLIRQEI